MRLETKKWIANLISDILNPIVLGLVLIVLFSFAVASGTLEAIKWSLILITVSILPVYLILFYMVRKGKIDNIFTVVREQRTMIYMVGGICAVAACLVLILLEAPPELVAAAVAGLSAAVIYLCVNLWWKISLHTAFVSASVVLLVILYGWVAMASIVLLPLMFWSRVELKRHSPSQVVAGAILAALIISVVFYVFLPWYQAV
jgi:membrane-associated phospholipid phosphatase